MRIWEARRQVVIPANTKALGFAVPAHHYGWIKRLAVRQTDTSNLQGFTVNVYSLPVVALAPGTQPPNSTPADLARIMPSITASAGSTAYFATEHFGYAYVNRQSSSLAAPERYIYVHIDQTSTPTVNTNWMICVVTCCE